MERELKVNYETHQKTTQHNRIERKGREEELILLRPHKENRRGEGKIDGVKNTLLTASPNHFSLSLLPPSISLVFVGKR